MPYIPEQDDPNGGGGKVNFVDDDGKYLWIPPPSGDFEPSEIDPEEYFQFIREAQAQNEALAREGLEAGLGYFEQAADYQTPFLGNYEGFNALKGGILGNAFGAQSQANAFTFKPSDPEYQQLFNQGVAAIDAGASASGLLHSGSRLKDLTNFGQGLANTYAGEVLNRRRAIGGDKFAHLGALANTEQAAANNLTNLWSGFGQLYTGTLSGLGAGALNAGQSAAQLGLNAAQSNATNALNAANLNQQWQLGVMNNQTQLQQIQQQQANQRSSSRGDLLGNLVALGGMFFKV